MDGFQVTPSRPEEARRHPGYPLKLHWTYGQCRSETADGRMVCSANVWLAAFNKQPSRNTHYAPSPERVAVYRNPADAITGTYRSGGEQRSRRRLLYVVQLHVVQLRDSLRPISQVHNSQVYKRRHDETVDAACDKSFAKAPLDRPCDEPASRPSVDIRRLQRVPCVPPRPLHRPGGCSPRAGHLARWCNGSTSAFGAAGEGSNPSRAAFA